MYGPCRAGAQIIFHESGRGLCHLTPTILAVRSAILATAWLLVLIRLAVVSACMTLKFSASSVLFIVSLDYCNSATVASKRILNAIAPLFWHPDNRPPRQSPSRIIAPMTGLRTVPHLQQTLTLCLNAVVLCHFDFFAVFFGESVILPITPV